MYVSNLGSNLDEWPSISINGVILLSRGKTSNSSRTVITATRISAVILPLSITYVAHGIVLPLYIQVGPPGKYFPGPCFVVALSETMFTISSFSGCTWTSIPDCQRIGTSVCLDWKITTHIITSPMVAVMGSRVKRWLELLHSDLGTLSTPTIFLLPALWPYFFCEVLHPVLSMKNIYLGFLNFYVVSSSVFLSFTENISYFVREDFFYWYCNAGIHHFGVYDIIYLHNKRHFFPICATRLEMFSSSSL